MKYVEEYLETVVKVKPLGELTTREDTLYDMSGEMVYIDGKCSDIFISHADYANWLEKQRQNPAEWHREDEQNLNACLGYIPDEFLRKWLRDTIHVKYDKPADMIESKFKVGDWIFSSVLGTARIIGVNDDKYQLEYVDGKQEFSSIDYVNYEYNEWTIQDAKDGDVLACNEEILLFKSYSIQGRISLYCWYNGQTNNFHSKEVVDTLMTTRNKICPATKEQRDLLFAKMKEAGYEWDAEKKELNKIHVIDEGKDEMDYCFTKMMNGEKVSSSEEDEEYNGEDYGIDSLYHAQRILEKTLGEVDGYQTDDGILSHKCAISAVKKLYGQKSATWSEEDEEMVEGLNNCLDELEKENGWCYIYVNDKNVKLNKVRNWLKSLKDRVQLQNTITDEELAKARKEAYNEVLDKIEYHDDWPTFDDGWSAAILYLKKINGKPQNTWKPSSELDETSYQVGIKRVLDNPESYGLTKYNWKPSDEQMKCLYTEVVGWTKGCPKQIVLESLYNGLKKLKGE